MPHTVKITKELDGERFLVLRVYIKSDGVSGDLSGFTLMDPTATLNPAKPAKPFGTIEEIWSDLDGFNMRLDFDDLIDPPAWTISQGAGPYVDFRSIGGIADRSGPDGTGKLLLSTFGLDAAAKQGTILIKMRK
jgi:hypothetical protein